MACVHKTPIINSGDSTQNENNHCPLLEKKGEEPNESENNANAQKPHHYDNSFFNDKEEPCYSEASLSANKKALLSAYEWNSKNIASLSAHDDIICKLHSLKTKPLLRKKRCLEAFCRC